jgi:hypothetical protein
MLVTVSRWGHNVLLVGAGLLVIAVLSAGA